MWLEEGKQSTRGLWKYLALLTALSSLVSGHLQGVPQALEQVATVEQRYGQHKEKVLAGEEEEMMWWRWDGGCEVVWCYIRSVNFAAIALQAPNAGQHSIDKKGTAFAAALEEVKRGLALIDKTHADQTPAAPCSMTSSHVSLTAAAWSVAERAALRLLLLDRAAMLFLCSSNLERALAALMGMLQCINQGLGEVRTFSQEMVGLAADGAVTLHCAISAYLTRVGDVGGTRSLKSCML
jgi:hypothetical protein